MMLSQNLGEYRKLLKTGESSARDAKILVEKSSMDYNSSKKPIYEGFLAVGKFFMAKHSLNPLKKMSYFKGGKTNLENALKADPKNLEIRLMRLITQENAPKILNYHQNISEDRKFLISEYNKTEDENLKIYIKKYLKI